MRSKNLLDLLLVRQLQLISLVILLIVLLLLGNLLRNILKNDFPMVVEASDCMMVHGMYHHIMFHLWTVEACFSGLLRCSVQLLAVCIHYAQTHSGNCLW